MFGEKARLARNRAKLDLEKRFETPTENQLLAAFLDPRLNEIDIFENVFGVDSYERAKNIAKDAYSSPEIAALILG